MADRAPHDQNLVAGLIAASTVNGTTAVTLEADPTTHALLTSQQSGIVVPFAYDYIAYTNTNATTDTYVYKSGGSGGTTVATVTIVFVDSTKAQMLTTTRV